jgi:O-antigen ligase
MGKRSRELRERRLRGETGPKRERLRIGSERILRAVIFGGTFLILFTPLILASRFFFPFVGPKSLYFMGLTEIIFFAWLFLAIFRKEYRPRLNPVLLSLVLFLAVSIVASLLGVDPFYSFWSKFERMTGVLMMIHLLAFFVVVSSFFKEKDWVKIFSVSIFVGAILSVIAMFSNDPAMRGGATVGNDSFLGTYVLFDLFFAVYLTLKAKGGLRIYSSICFFIMATWLLLSGARAAKLSFLGGLILLFFLWLALNKKRNLKIAGISLLGISLVLAVAFVIFAFQPDSFVGKQIIDRAVGDTFGGRFVVWQGAWQGFLDRPILGWGLENFEYSFAVHFNPCLGSPRCGSDIWYDRAHNIIFDTLVNSGIIGLLAYVMIFAALFWVLWKQYVRKNIDLWTAGIFSSVLVAYSVQNLTVFDMISSYMIFFLTMGFIGLIASEKRTTQTNLLGLDQEAGPSSQAADFRKENKLRERLMAIFLFILLIVCLSWFVIKPAQTDYYVIQAIETQGSQQRVALYKKALSTSSVGRYQIAEQFADYSLALMPNVGSSISVADFKTELDFLIGQFEGMTKHSSDNVGLDLKLGEIYNAYSRLDPQKLSLAEQFLNKALSINPENQQVLWELVQTRLYQGQYQDALSLAEKTMNLEPARGQGHFVLIQVAKIMGNQTLANQAAAEALKINPDWESRIKAILGS